MIRISSTLALNESELEFTFIRSPGPGGQNVNKLASGVHLKFNVLQASSLPTPILLRIATQNKLTVAGDLIIKATRFRSQERNKADAIERLIKLIRRAAIVPKRRIKTKTPYIVKRARLGEKRLHAKTKARRRKLIEED